MDRRVKERLIGASILVVLVVLIVPELLSGPKRPAAPAVPLIPVASGAAEAVRNVTVDLATSKATPEDATGASSAADPTSSAGTPAPAGMAVAASPTITTLKAQQANPLPVAGEPAVPPPAATVPAARVPAAGVPAAGGAAAAVAAAAAAAGAATPITPAPAGGAHHGWAVQLGSFASKDNAEALVRHLRTEKVPAYVSPTGSGRSLRFRVRVGPLADRPAAQRMIVRLKQEGQGALVPP